MLKTVFYGTHSFAVTILQGLIDSPLFDVQFVITQADKPMGRKKILTAPPVKILAEKHALRIEQPLSLKTYELPETFDIAIVSQYGKIIPERLLNIPTYKTLNTHTSLLPKYRGASPIQMALYNGETKTGTTLMLMDAGMDTGPIIAQSVLPLDSDDTYESVEQKLADMTVKIIDMSIPLYVNGTIIPEEQDDSQATLCSLLKKEQGQVDWTRSAQDIYNQYRGFHQWPGIWSIWQGKRVKFLDIRLAEVSTDAKPGTFFNKNQNLYIRTGHGVLQIHTLQLEGKQAMQAEAFVNGYAGQFEKYILDSKE